MQVRFRLNGNLVTVDVEPRMHLADCLRDELRQTGTLLGCEHGVCGACTVVLDGDPVRACLVLAAQAQGRRVDTVESLGTPEELHPSQEALRDARGLQCGFCTPGVAVLSAWLRERLPEADDARIREVLSSCLCRCTGYGPIVAAASRA